MVKNKSSLLIIVTIIFLVSIYTTNSLDKKIIQEFDKSNVEYNNISDNFSTSPAGADDVLGITTDGSTLWILDRSDRFVYHFDFNGNNLSDGFSIQPSGIKTAWGITTDGSTFWVIDQTAKFVYHFDFNGNNLSDGFSIQPPIFIPASITTDGSTLWITDFEMTGSSYIYHFDKNGNDLGDGFSSDLDLPYGITTDGSSLWIAEFKTNFLYHLDFNGNDLGDGFSLSDIIVVEGPGPSGPQFITSDQELNHGIINNLWIVAGENDFIYHINPQDYNATQPEYTCGDVNNDGSITTADIIYLINYVFKGGPTPSFIESGDVNADGLINDVDIFYLINYVFKSGPEPICGQEQTTTDFSYTQTELLETQENLQEENIDVTLVEETKEIKKKLHLPSVKKNQKENN